MSEAIRKVHQMPDTDMTDRVLGHLSTAILLLDGGMAVLFSNQAAENLLLGSTKQMNQCALSDLLQNSTELEALVNAALSTDQVYTRRQMSLLLLSAAKDVTADVTVTPIIGAEQALVELIPMDRYLRIDRDAAINEHHEVTRQMVRGLAHEIKNPLGGIKGSARLLERELPAEDLKEFTDIIIKEADRLTALVDRMLGSNVIPEMAATNIHRVLERVAKLIELDSGTPLTVERDYDPSLPEVIADHELLLQALLNVTRNAMQVLDKVEDATITLRTRIERQFTIIGNRHRAVLRIDIMDNGPGIDEDIQQHLFYPMISRRKGGTGLGLTFAQSIISQHHGMIEFESRPGETIFSIYIPLEQTQ